MSQHQQQNYQQIPDEQFQNFGLQSQQQQIYDRKPQQILQQQQNFNQQIGQRNYDQPLQPYVQRIQNPVEQQQLRQHARQQQFQQTQNLDQSIMPFDNSSSIITTNLPFKKITDNDNDLFRVRANHAKLKQRFRLLEQQVNQPLANMATLEHVMLALAPLVAQIPLYTGQEPPDAYIDKMEQLFTYGTALNIMPVIQPAMPITQPVTNPTQNIINSNQQVIDQLKSLIMQNKAVKIRDPIAPPPIFQSPQQYKEDRWLYDMGLVDDETWKRFYPNEPFQRFCPKTEKAKKYAEMKDKYKMYRTKVDLVTCYVGFKKVNCNLSPGFQFSMCSDKTLNQLGFKIDRPISSEDREMQQRLLDELQIYTTRIVIDMLDCWVRTVLHIKSLSGYKNKWLHIPVIVIYQDYTETDSDSDTTSTSSSDLEYKHHISRKKKTTKNVYT
ncbi:10942_t:CDS:2 [Entrophospora sp. SA101]|nr:10942_t:CDS:2 [Entrophospora sp. SA101]